MDRPLATNGRSREGHRQTDRRYKKGEIEEDSERDRDGQMAREKMGDGRT